MPLNARAMTARHAGRRSMATDSSNFSPSRNQSLRIRIVIACALACVALIARELINAQSGITLVQHTSRDAGTTASATLAFPANNAAGNWIGVAIRSGLSGQAFTVSDSRGNTYRSAVQYNVTADTPNGDTLA